MKRIITAIQNKIKSRKIARENMDKAIRATKRMMELCSDIEKSDRVANAALEQAHKPHHQSWTALYLPL